MFLHVCLSECIRGFLCACILMCVSVQSLGGCSPCCLVIALFPCPKTCRLPYSTVFIMLIRRKTGWRRRGGGTPQKERRANLSPPLFVSSFSPPPPFFLPPLTRLSSHPCTLFICRFLIIPFTSLIIPQNIVFIITHNNDSHPCRRNVRRAWRIFHRWRPVCELITLLLI